jgi:hypothetical protein
MGAGTVVRFNSQSEEGLSMRRALPFILIAGLFVLSISAMGQSNACDLTLDGRVDQADVESAINMALGLSPCSANIFGSGVCNVVVVQRVVNASLGGTCVTGTTRSVLLTWTASVSPDVTGYKVYRGTSATGPYSPIATLGGATSFTDNNVQSGQTYYYVVTAVNGSGESAFSNQAQAIIPLQ